MPMDMKEIIAEAAKKLLMEQNAKKLTVKDIVEECQITRQPFTIILRIFLRNPLGSGAGYQKNAAGGADPWQWGTEASVFFSGRHQCGPLCAKGNAEQLPG